MRGILFVLKTGMQWNMLPSDAFGVSGVTCWRRMREWAKGGVSARVWRDHLQALAWVQAMDWEHALVDADTVPAKKKVMPRAPHRPRQGGQQTPSDDRWVRHAHFARSHRRKPARS